MVSKALQWLICAVLVCGTAAQALPAQPVVAQATMVIGQASILRADGSAISVVRGVEVRVGDTVRTELGGHVHLRFVDGGRVSVRPASTLQIDSYAYTEGKPQDGAIKFKLEEGVVRSITGDWGAAARDRFRLNTPLAAIGVKGTDFIVKATSDSTAATVFTGAISVAPLEGVCGMGLGPCQEGHLLSQDMRGQMLQLVRLQPAPSLVPATDLIVASLPQQIVSSADRTERKSATTDTGVLLASADKVLFSDVQLAAAAAASQEVAPSSPYSNTLGWARYPWAQILSEDDFSQQIDSAMLQSQERLAGNGSYVLLREFQDGHPVVYAPGTGVAQFKLESASASVLRGNANEAVSISAASLGVNFDQSSFSTRLEVQGAQLGRDVVQAAGHISATGLLQATSGNTSLQGGLSADGREAGYLFQKTVPTGVLQGITLWGR